MAFINRLMHILQILCFCFRIALSMLIIFYKEKRMMHTNTRLLLSLLYIGMSVAPFARAAQEIPGSLHDEQVELDHQEYEYVDGVKCPCNKPKPKRKLLISAAPRSGEELVKTVVDELVKPTWVAVDEADTDLSEDVLHKLTRDNKAAVTHICATDKTVRLAQEQQLNVLYVVKDPRDYVYATAQWIKNVAHKDGVSAKSIHDLVVDLIKDVDFVYRSYTPWMSYKNTLVVRSESLAGKEEEQVEEILKLARHLGVPADRQKAHRIALLCQKEEETYKSSGTWKQEFTQEHKELFKDVAGQLLIDLGYEKDLNW